MQNGSKANHVSSLPLPHCPELSNNSVSVFISSYSCYFHPEEAASLIAASLKLTLVKYPAFSILYTVIAKVFPASYTLEITAFNCTCTVHVLHSVPWLVSPVRQLHPKSTEAGLISTYLLSTYKICFSKHSLGTCPK